MHTLDIDVYMFTLQQKYCENCHIKKYHHYQQQEQQEEEEEEQEYYTIHLFVSLYHTCLRHVLLSAAGFNEGRL